MGRRHGQNLKLAVALTILIDRAGPVSRIKPPGSNTLADAERFSSGVACHHVLKTRHRLRLISSDRQSSFPERIVQRCGHPYTLHAMMLFSMVRPPPSSNAVVV